MALFWPVHSQLWRWCRCLAAVRGGEQAAQAAAAAHAQVAYAPADAFLQHATTLLIAKLQAACLIRLKVVTLNSLRYCFLWRVAGDCMPQASVP